jgi:hypothetical protein
VLGSLYAGAVVVLGQVLNPQGGDSALAVAASTLLVAVLFQPLRRRLQDMVGRRFNRRRHDAANTIEAFAARLHRQLDLDTLAAELLAWSTRPCSQPRHRCGLDPRPRRSRAPAMQWRSVRLHGRPDLRHPVRGVPKQGS